MAFPKRPDSAIKEYYTYAVSNTVARGEDAPCDRCGKRPKPGDEMHLWSKLANAPPMHAMRSSQFCHDCHAEFAMHEHVLEMAVWGFAVDIEFPPDINGGTISGEAGSHHEAQLIAESAALEMELLKAIDAPPARGWAYDVERTDLPIFEADVAAKGLQTMAIPSN